jgi:7,8-dihydropterin-6-yl-methyl-4-(beta-D-ribofuranosyl)aminobenzene 5'-phosphate synthase
MNLFPNEEIAAVIGGMHLKNIGSARLEATIQQFMELGVKRIVPLHCTGPHAVWEMKKALKERITYLVCGDELVLET